MTYPDLFKSRYPVLKGKDWIRTIESDDQKVFISIGLEEMQHGKLGGQAIVKKKGKKYMSSIGRIGAIAANSIRAWKKAVEEEALKEFDL